MRYDEFVNEFGVTGINPVTLRQWKKRDRVPLHVVTEAQNRVTNPIPVTEIVTDGVTKAAVVTKPRDKGAEKRDKPAGCTDNVGTDVTLVTVIPSAEVGHPEFDIMGDGWARGFACDVLVPSNRAYRTSHAIRRFAEKVGDPDKVKPWTEEFWQKHSETVESRLAFFKKLAGAK